VVAPSAPAPRPPKPREPKPPKPASPGLPAAQAARFDRFWAVYPKRVSKGQAQSAWAKLNPDDALTERIIAAVQVAKDKDHRFTGDGRYIPYPSTWLNARGWEDDHTAPVEDKNARWIRMAEEMRRAQEGRTADESDKDNHKPEEGWE
jgi:hypothetical protein